MTTATDAAPMTVTASQRSRILRYAAELIRPGERLPEAVITAAEPLLAWAAAATSDADQNARMRAMDHVHSNAPQYRVGFYSDTEIPSRPTPVRFVNDARTYYQFLTAA